MDEISIRPANPDEIDWVNEKYKEVNFLSSDYANEFIVIAYVNNEKAGLGRLVKIDESNFELGGIYVFPDYRRLGVANRIVSSLIEKNPFKDAIIWCLPFENLKAFYLSFGFEHYTSGEIPEKIAKKLTWCNSDSQYENKVVLLCNKRKVIYL